MHWTRHSRVLSVWFAAAAAIMLAAGGVCPALAQQLSGGAATSALTINPEAAKLVLNSADGPPLTKSDGTGVVDQVLKVAFRMTGIEISTISVPAERALLNANDGIEDGTYSRIAGMNERYPNLVRVPETLLNFEFVAFSRRVDVETKGWESLRPFDVAIITGWKILEENIKSARSLHKVRDQTVLFNLLVNDRVDVVVYSRLGGEFVIKELGLRDVRTLEPPLAMREMFLYLNKKHASLVVPVANALRTMRVNGDYQRIMDRVKSP